MIVGRRAAVFAMLVVAAACAPPAPRPAPTAASLTSTSTTRATVAASTSDERSSLQRVLTVGDGVMFDLEPALAAAFGPEVVVTPRGYFGMGLSRPEQWDWRRGWDNELAATRPDLVVVLQGVWDARTVTVGTTTYEPWSTTWIGWYSHLVAEALDRLTATGARVLWISTLDEADPAKSHRIDAVNAIARGVVAARAGSRWLDGNVVLAGAPQGYRAMTTGASGAVVPLRKRDGEHLCAEGAARLGRAVREATALDFAVEAPSGWAEGDWRHDARYDVAEGCLG